MNAVSWLTRQVRDDHMAVGSIGQITSKDEQHGSVDEILERSVS
jgi:hypothetical protein